MVAYHGMGLAQGSLIKFIPRGICNWKLHSRKKRMPASNKPRGYRHCWICASHHLLARRVPCSHADQRGQRQKPAFAGKEEKPMTKTVLLASAAVLGLG